MSNEILSSNNVLIWSVLEWLLGIIVKTKALFVFYFLVLQVTTVDCSIGNPFKKESKLSLVIQLTDAGNLTLVDGFKVSTQLLTSSVQPDHDQVFTYDALVRVQAQMRLAGYSSSSQQIVFGGEVIGESAVTKASQAGSVIAHSYEVDNFGVTAMTDVGLLISWPAETANGKWLFYLLNIVISSSNSRDIVTSSCDIPNEINDPLKLYNPQNARRKRKAPSETGVASEPPMSAVGSSYEPDTDLVCPHVKGCYPIFCPLGAMQPKDKFYVKISTIVWNSTLVEEYEGIGLIKVGSSANVTTPLDNIKYGIGSILTTDVFTSIEGKTVLTPKQEISIWVVFGATAVGVVLLVFLVLILWRCGFFERKHSVGYHNASSHLQASKQASKNADYSQTSRNYTY